jgi:ketosteroid isomerase-like protein
MLVAMRAFALLITVSVSQYIHAATPEDQVKAVLTQYKTALESRDLTGVEALFAEPNEVIENGKIEGTYADYRDHHIGPELAHIESFAFSDYAVKVRFEGPVALSTETYRYTIHLKDTAEPIIRQGVATSVLTRAGERWKIVSHHSSSRAPKPPK